MKKVPVMLYEPKRQSFQVMRRRIAIACICLVVLFQLHCYHQANRSQQLLTDENDDLLAAAPAEFARTGNSIDRLHKLAWTKLAKSLESNRPLTATSLRVTEHVPVISLHSPHRLDKFDAVPIDPKTIMGLSSAHFRFVNQIRYRFDSSVYLEGKRGIVMTAAGGRLGAALVQLRLLRRTRSRLPVDVFLVGREDYDAEICEKLMPSLNARCRILQDLMGNYSTSLENQSAAAIQPRNIVANEPLHKLLALFFSDWEENLMLGYDTLVYNNPDGMFQEEPYLSHGLIIWPDQWVSSISPKMDHIQRKRFPNSNEKSSTVDMGQLVVSKSMQRKTLLLAIYYTFYGPKLYDVLLRQSTAGEEGSQAIKVAARYFDAPFFIIRRDVEAVGYTKLNEKAAKKTSSSTQHTFQGVATLQHFALEDYHRQPYEQHRPAFIRASKPVLDPLTITQSSTIAELRDLGSNKAQHRLWQTFSARHESNGWQDSDPENALWYEMETVACHQLASIPQYAERAARACHEIDTHRTTL